MNASTPKTPRPNVREVNREHLPLPNYTLSSVCPQCHHPTFKLACKVRCGKCGFMWDCSEL